MFEKIIIAVILVLAAVLVFSGCSTVEKTEDAVESRKDALEDNLESKFAPIEEALESREDAIEDAVESQLEQLEEILDDVIQNNTEAVSDNTVQNEEIATQSKSDVTENTTANNAQEIASEYVAPLKDSLNSIGKETESSRETPSEKMNKFNSDKNAITKEQAKTIALRHANAAAEDVRLLRAEIDAENGRWLYEVSFCIGNVEYEYEILADSGEIVKAERERID